MADYVLSAKGTYDGSDMDTGLDRSASKLEKLKSTASSVGSQVAGFFVNSFSGVAKSIATGIGTVTAGVTTLAATGGMSRALNIEKAQTMFKGAKLEWGDYYQTVMDSVDGTAFGFDTAAQAAAQLASSGVAAGGDMEKALNGCVGTAATFGKDLGDLSSIWARVAASGKLTGEQVAQFTDRGINSISVLSSYLGKTSSEVSAMVSAGKIDFQTFSDAMYAAFGDSAKAANETFTGSMANMKAALSKIGQDWMTPLKDSAVPVFNSIRGVLNSCRSALKPLSTAFGEFLGVTYDAQGNLTRTGGAVEKLCGFLDGLAEKIEGVDLSSLGTGGKVAAAALAALAAVSLGGLIGQIPVLGSLANSLTGGLVPALQGVKTSFGLLTPAAQVAAAGITAFMAVFAYCYATNEQFRNSVNGLVGSIASSLAPAFQSLTGLVGPLQSLFGAVCNVVMTLSTAFLGVVAAVAPLVSTIVSSLVPILAVVIEAVAQVVNVVVATVAPVIQQVTDLITANMPIIQQVVSDACTLIHAVVSTVLPVLVEIITSAMTAIQAVIDAVWPYISAIVTSAMQVIQSVISIALGVINGDWDSVWTAIQTLLSSVWSIIQNVVSGAVAFVQAVIQNGLALIQSVWSSVWSVISGVLSSVWNAIKGAVSSAINAVRSTISSVLNGIRSTWDSVWNGIKSFFSSIWSGIKSGARSGIDAVYSTVTGIKDRILGFFSGAGSWLVNAGSSILQGLKDGIMGAIGSVTSAVSGAVGKIRSLFPFSPAKEGPFSGHGYTTWSGKALMDDWAKGMESRERSVKGTASRMLEAAQGTFAGRLNMGGVNVSYATGAASAAGSVTKGDSYYLTIDGNTVGADNEVANAIDVLVAAARRSSTARR